MVTVRDISGAASDLTDALFDLTQMQFADHEAEGFRRQLLLVSQRRADFLANPGGGNFSDAKAALGDATAACAACAPGNPALVAGVSTSVQKAAAQLAGITVPGNPVHAAFPETATPAARSMGMLTGALRIGGSPKSESVGFSAQDAGAGSGGPADATTDGHARADAREQYLGRLTALFPAEALSLYGLGQGIFLGQAKNLAIAACICMVVLIIVRYQATKLVAGGPPQWLAVGIASVSFFLWISSIGGSFDFVSVVAFALDQKWAIFGAAVWTVLVPIFYTGRESAA